MVLRSQYQPTWKTCQQTQLTSAKALAGSRQAASIFVKREIARTSDAVEQTIDDRDDAATVELTFTAEAEVQTDGVSGSQPAMLFGCGSLSKHQSPVTQGEMGGAVNTPLQMLITARARRPAAT